MKTVTVKATCVADVVETWTFEVPDNWKQGDDVDEDFAWLTEHGKNMSVENDLSEERDRDIVSFEVAEAPEIPAAPKHEPEWD